MPFINLYMDGLLKHMVPPPLLYYVAILFISPRQTIDPSEDIAYFE